MIPLHDDNPTTRPPIVTVTLIVICSVMFLYQQFGDPAGGHLISFTLGAIPATIFDDIQRSPELTWVAPELTVLTSMFLHGGWMHLIGNMLFLWVFGNNIEDAMGSVKFLAFYVICGILAFLAHGLLDPASKIPLIGASGAISGVLGAYALLYPKARVLVLVPLIVIFWTMRLWASVVLGGWFVLQFYNVLQAGGGDGGGVAWWAHIGGFVAGMVLIVFFKDRHVRLLHGIRSPAGVAPPAPSIGDDIAAGRRPQSPWTETDAAPRQRSESSDTTSSHIPSSRRNKK